MALSCKMGRTRAMIPEVQSASQSSFFVVWLSIPVRPVAARRILSVLHWLVESRFIRPPKTV